jgi:hypothetical protein
MTPQTVQPMKDFVQGEKLPMVDSKERQLNIGEILAIACANTDSEYPPNVVALSIMQELAQGADKAIFGNTAFIVHPSEEDRSNVFFRALNADTAQNYVDNNIQFVQWAYEQGYDMGVTMFEGDAILKIIKLTAEHYADQPLPGVGFEAFQTKGGGYQVLVRFGPDR